ncbi:hypothetical protein ES703_100536 [subsurface metagenome]
MPSQGKGSGVSLLLFNAIRYDLEAWGVFFPSASKLFGLQGLAQPQLGQPPDDEAG